MTDTGQLFHVRKLIEFYSESPLMFGTVDLFCMGPSDNAERIADALAVLALMRSDDPTRALRALVVIRPASLAANPALSKEELSCATRNNVGLLVGRSLTSAEESRFDELVDVVNCDTLELDAIIRSIEQEPDNTAFIILDVARLRDRDTQSGGGRARTLMLAEDWWCPALKNSIEKLIATARALNCYVIADAGEYMPHQEHNRALLMQIDGCSVFAAEAKSDPAALIAREAPKWQSMMQAGEIGAALAAIDALPESLTEHKGVLKIQLLHKFVPSNFVVDLIRKEIAKRSDIDGQMRTRLARIASASGEAALARDLLQPAISELTEQQWLDVALDVAVDLGETPLVEECETRLLSLFPHAPDAHRTRVERLISEGSPRSDIALREARRYLPENEISFYEHLHRIPSSAQAVDYENALQQAETLWPARSPFAARVLVQHAVDCRSNAALKLVIAKKRDSSTLRFPGLLIYVLKQLLLARRSDGGSVLSREELKQPVNMLLAHLGENPGDAMTRLGLTNLLAVETTGLYGLAIAASTAFSLAAHNELQEDKGQVSKSNKASERDLLAFVEAALPWMAEHSPVVLGVTKLPVELFRCDPDAILPDLHLLLDETARNLTTDGDVNTFQQLITLCALVAPHTSKPYEDLVFLRLGAARLMSVGRLQLGRDLAEQALQLAGRDELRRRLAWFGFADVYHWGNNYVEALTGLCCAFTCRVPTTPEQAWYEIYLLIRLLRDLHLTSIAADLLPIARNVLRWVGNHPRYAHRLNTVDVGLQLAEAAQASVRTSDDVLQLMNNAEALCEEALSVDDEIAPVASLLAQAVHLAHLDGVNVPGHVIEVFNRALGIIPEHSRSIISSLAKTAPSLSELTAIAQQIQESRYDEDIAFDLRRPAIAAHRFLGTQEAMDDARAAAYAIEIVADQSVRYTLTNDHRRNASLASPDLTAEAALQTSTMGIDVILLGTSASGQLVLVRATDGSFKDVVRENSQTFSAKALHSWSDSYPYAYGAAHDDPNVFYRTMDNIGLSFAPATRTVFVCSTDVQQIPVNLLMAGGDFVGRTTPLASAPSLKWLQAARTNDNGEPTRDLAWIPTAAAQDGSATLAMVADRLGPALEQHGVTLDTRSTVPPGIMGSSMVIVAAHGGLLPERQFFHTVSDDDQMRVRGSFFAGEVRNVRLVILFVCSGGRIDQHPFASTTVSLVKELLDGGCSTVIASPWPLDSRVPSHWLPEFLERWASGAEVIDAAFHANKAVERAMGDSPAYCLALTVYGDPLLVRGGH